VALQTAIRHPARVNTLVVISIPFKRTGWYPEIQIATRNLASKNNRTYVSLPGKSGTPCLKGQGHGERLFHRKSLTSGHLSLHEQSWSCRWSSDTGLRKREPPGLRARGSTESTLECHPSSNHCPPRRSGWRYAYACIAIAKGFITRASTRWAVICQQFSGSFC
jgi:pimeloyl-ACP methyl ester carboxylesterase